MQPLVRSLALLGMVMIVGPVLAQPYPHIAPTEPLTPEQEKTHLRVPPGFEIQLVASEPTIHKPMNLVFDARGRLWVTESVEYPFAAQGRPGRDRIVILEDFGSDGKARKATVFAEGLNIPIGILPLPSCNEAIVFSIPYLYRLTDTDGDGKADKKEELYGIFGARDTHGMVNSLTLGLDGWVYACHGFANESVVKGKNGQELRMHSGNTFRFRPDGSAVESWTRGQVNPFGMAVDDQFNLYTADCHSRPMTQLLRGAYYDSFGKPHDGLGYGPNMIGHNHGSTGLSGLVYYASDQFPKEYYGRMFVGNCVTNTVNMDVLQFFGSTPKAIEQPDFIRSSDLWFRPVYLTLGPDGALYVADFYNCIIGHYEVPLTHPRRDRERGRIWRVIWRGTEATKTTPPSIPRGDYTQASIDDLIADLASPRLAVRMLATHQLMHRGGAEAKSKLKDPQRLTTETQRAHALWILEALGALTEEEIDSALQSSSALQRGWAVRLLSERRHVAEKHRQAVAQRLHDADPWVVREAALASSRQPAVFHCRREIFLALKKTPAEDTHLRHALRMALRDQFRDPQAWHGVETQLATDIAARDALLDIVLGLNSIEMASFVVREMQQRSLPANRLPEWVRHAARYADAETRTQLTQWLMSDRLTDENLRNQLLHSYQLGAATAGMPLSEALRAYLLARVGRYLESAQAHDIEVGLRLATGIPTTPLWPTLARLARGKNQPEKLRSQVLPVLLSSDRTAATALLGELLTSADEPIALREQAAQLLGGIGSEESRHALAKALTQAPARLASPIALALATHPAGQEQLLQLVQQGKASPRLLREKPIEARFQAGNLPKWRERLETLTKDLPGDDARLGQLLAQRRAAFFKATPDLALGKQIFTKNCAACHQIANEGGKIAPQLDGIGNRGLDRLLEDILDPNRNVDQAFRASTLALKNGQLITGLILREEGNLIVLADQTGKELRISKAEVEERIGSTLSPMPANFDQSISEVDFSHLLGYLLSQRAVVIPQPK